MRSAIGYWPEFYHAGRLLGVGVIEEHDFYMRGMS
jgi:hypothetical protein